MEQISVSIPRSINPTLQLPDPDLVRYYSDDENRIIWMLEEVDENGYDWVERIIRYNQEDRNVPVYERKPIKCIFSNYGGSLEVAQMLVEIIKISKTPVHGIALGMCASAASMIYLSCHCRLATPNATFLFHRGSCNNVEGTYNQLNSFMEKYRSDIDKMTEFYKTYTTFPEEEIEYQLETGDWYVSCEEGYENGVVDKIITDMEDIYGD